MALHVVQFTLFASPLKTEISYTGRIPASPHASLQWSKTLQYSAYKMCRLAIRKPYFQKFTQNSNSTFLPSWMPAMNEERYYKSIMFTNVSLNYQNQLFPTIHTIPPTLLSSHPKYCPWLKRRHYKLVLTIRNSYLFPTIHAILPISYFLPSQMRTMNNVKTS